MIVPTQEAILVTQTPDFFAIPFKGIRWCLLRDRLSGLSKMLEGAKPFIASGDPMGSYVLGIVDEIMGPEPLIEIAGQSAIDKETRP